MSNLATKFHVRLGIKISRQTWGQNFTSALTTKFHVRLDEKISRQPWSVTWQEMGQETWRGNLLRKLDEETWRENLTRKLDEETWRGNLTRNLMINLTTKFHARLDDKNPLILWTFHEKPSTPFLFWPYLSPLVASKIESKCRSGAEYSLSQSSLSITNQNKDYNSNKRIALFTSSSFLLPQQHNDDLLQLNLQYILISCQHQQQLGKWICRTTSYRSQCKW